MRDSSSVFRLFESPLALILSCSSYSLACFFDKDKETRVVAIKVMWCV